MNLLKILSAKGTQATNSLGDLKLRNFQLVVWFGLFFDLDQSVVKWCTDTVETTKKESMIDPNLHNVKKE